MAVTFGVNIASLNASGGLPGVIMNPGGMSAEAQTELIGVIISLCAIPLMILAEKPQLWVLRMIIGICIISLGYGWLDSKVSLSKLQNSMKSSLESHVEASSKATDRDSKYRLARANSPEVYYVLANAYLYSDKLERGKKIEEGGKWFLLDGESKSDDKTKIEYLPVASCENETIIGYVRFDMLSHSGPKTVVKALVKPLVKSPEVAKTSVVKKPKRVTPPTKSSVAPQKLLPQPLKRSVATSDGSITLGSDGAWVNTNIIPKKNDRVTIKFPDIKNSRADTYRLKMKNGTVTFEDFEPISDGSGGYYVTLSFINGGNNTPNDPLELAIKHGLPLKVKVKKL
jgi:hypothetical protein